MEKGRFPNKLKKYRRCAGYSQKKLARLLGLTDTSVISRWEHGVVLPAMVQVFKLSQVFETLPHLLYEPYWNELTATDSLCTHENHVF